MDSLPSPRRSPSSALTLALALALPLGGALVAGCGGGDPLTRIESTYSGMVDHVCRACPAAAGATTEADCRATAAANSPFDGPEWDCQRSAYQRFPSELGPYYDCFARAVTSFDSCMRNATRTCPPASTDVSACSDQLDTATSACPRPDSVMALEAVSACFASP